MYGVDLFDILFTWFPLTKILTINTLFTEGHKIFLEAKTNHLEIKTMEVSGTLEKDLEFFGTLFFMSKETLSGLWNHPEDLRNLWNIPK